MKKYELNKGCLIRKDFGVSDFSYGRSAKHHSYILEDAIKVYARNKESAIRKISKILNKKYKVDNYLTYDGFYRDLISWDRDSVKECM